MAWMARQCLVRFTNRIDTPDTQLLRSFSFRPALGYGYESAAPAVMGSLSYGGYGGASSSLHWYRVSSFLLNPILKLRKHDAHPKDAPQRLMVRPGTLDACAELVLYRHSLRSPLFSLRSGYRCCSPLTHSCRCRRSTLPCLHFTAHRHRHNTKSILEASSRLDFENNFSHTCPK